jgi:hypothetical protein
MAIVQALLLSLLYAALGAGFLLALPVLLGWRAKRYPQALVPIALGLGFMLGYARLLEQWPPPFPPIDSTRWIFYLLVPVALWGGFLNLKQPPTWLVWGARICLSGCAQFLLLRPLSEGSLASTWLFWVIGIALLTTFVWSGLDRLAEQQGSLLQPFTGSIVAAASGVLLMFAHSVVLSQQALILAVLMGLVFLLGLIQPRTHWRGLWGVPIIGLSMLWSGGSFFAELSPAVLLLLPVLFCPWLAETPWLRNKPIWLRRGLPLLLAIFLSGVAVGGVILSQPPDNSSGYY